MLDQAGMFEQVVINPQQVIDETARAINRVKQRLAVDGVKYHRTGEHYDMTLFENSELQTYLYDAAMKSGAIAVGDQAKTIYDYVAVDSEVEQRIHAIVGGQYRRFSFILSYQVGLRLIRQSASIIQIGQ